MKRQIAFARKIDIKKNYQVSFTLEPLDKRDKGIAVSVSYGISVDNPELILADVWAGVAGGDTMRFLYTEQFLQSEVKLEDYTGLAVKVYNSPRFQEVLGRIYNEL